MKVDLFSPVKIGSFECKNRIVMAPLTRARTLDDRRIPNDLMAEYYEQRSGAGLILTEATSISPMAVGYAYTPGIWSEEQVEGWKKITKAVHKHQSKIVLQLWHVGRISDPVFLGGELPVAPSAVRPAGKVSLVRPEKEFVTPRALATEEISGIVEDYRRGAINAQKAGFDGVEIHAANGYLIEQFLSESTNLRTDQYGGSIENRARFLLEITDALLTVWEPGLIGVHLSPRSDAHDVKNSKPKEIFEYLALEFKKRNIGFLFAREYPGADAIGPHLKKTFGGSFIANEKFTKELAEDYLNQGHADAISFGTLFISNPDLPKRLAHNLPLNETNFATIYSRDAVGYTDYPFYELKAE